MEDVTASLSHCMGTLLQKGRDESSTAIAQPDPCLPERGWDSVPKGKGPGRPFREVTGGLGMCMM